MYHIEKIINGVLCWKGTPDTEWQPYTAEQLTAKIEELQAENNKLREIERRY